MAEVKIAVGARLNNLSADEVADTMRGEYDAYLREKARGVKWMKMPQFSGKASGNVLQIGQSVMAGPESGYLWSVRRLYVTGLTTGATPDVVNFFLNDYGANQQPLWTLNGNSNGVTFGRFEIVIPGGSILVAASSGTFNATGLIVVSGDVIEVPSERVAELI